jgi:hypothetical protein
MPTGVDLVECRLLLCGKVRKIVTRGGAKAGGCGSCGISVPASPEIRKISGAAGYRANR